ncbi:hypothetical protein EMN47_18740 [Prolixibacteraceae bacterium JC049]|nr:hypothetical protein [Prolixibacteraceae bacterium JC049]
MKTSKYFVIGYAAFILLGLFVLYALAGTQGKECRAKEHHMYRAEKDLQPFSVVVAEEGVNFRLKTANQFKAVLFSRKDTALKVPDYKIKNDTLFLTKATITKGIQPLFIGKQFKAVIGKQNNRINFEHIKSDDKLLLQLNKGKVWGQVTAPEVTVEAQYSEVNLNHSKIDQLKCNLLKTKSYYHGNNINTIEATLREHSKIYGRAQTKIILDVDKSSSYNIHK